MAALLLNINKNKSDIESLEKNNTNISSKIDNFTQHFFKIG